MSAPRFDKSASVKALEAFFKDHLPPQPDDKTKKTTEWGKGKGKLRLLKKDIQSSIPKPFATDLLVKFKVHS